jgi:DNA-binding LacI/PurR family transcriptional regulator
MLNKILQKLQELPYGNLGIAIALAAAIFSGTWTICESSGVQGSLTVVLFIGYLSTIIGFLMLRYLEKRQYQRTLSIAKLQGSVLNKSERSRNLGVVAPISFWATDYYIEIIKAIRQSADREQRHYQRRVIVIDVPHEELSDVDATLADAIIRQVSGLILINIQINDKARQDLCQMCTPVVSVSHKDSIPPFVSSILPDHSGFAELLEHTLVQKKAEAAVLVTKGLANPYKGLKVDPFREEKREIYSSAVQRAGLLLHPLDSLVGLPDTFAVSPGNAYILEIDQYLTENGNLLFNKLSRSLPEYTSLVFLADSTALGFLIACKKDGRTARERKLRVVGFDNTKVSEWFGLSTVDYQLNVVGRLAYEKLQTALDYPDQFNHAEEKVKTLCIIRESSNW